MKNWQKWTLGFFIIGIIFFIFIGMYMQESRLWNKASEYYKKGKYDEAISIGSKFIKKFPKNTDLYINRGLSYVGKGDYDQAISDFNKAIQIDSKTTAAYRARAYIYIY